MTAARHWSPALVLLVFASCGARIPPRVTAEALPRTYEGRYLWAARAAECGYQVVLTIDVATARDGGGPIVVRGATHYQPGDSRMTVDGAIDPATLHITLRESAANHPDAVTRGTFEGTLSADLRSLVAIWTTATDGQLGVLVLHVPQAEGPPGVSRPPVAHGPPTDD